MRTRFTHRRHEWSAGFLLALLLLRAYVPVGFMPAAGMPFALELCPDVAAVPAALPMDAAMPMPMPAHHHPAGTSGHDPHCPFGSAPSMGPAAYCISFQPPASPALFRVAGFTQLQVEVRAPLAHRPRGPPVHA